MENNCTPCCNSANRLVEIPYEELRQLIRDSERFSIAKEIFERCHSSYNLENTLNPILGNSSEENSDE